MARRVKATKIHSSAQRISPRSRTVKHVKLRLTVGILVVLLLVVGAYALVTHLRTERSEGSVEVVVGSALMACLEPADVEAETTLLDALEEVSVRPTSQQILRLTVDGQSIEITAQQAGEMTLAAQGDALMLKTAEETLGSVTRIYLPTDSDSVKTID